MSAWDGDLLNRKPIADFLTNFLDEQDDARVLNIDAPWGEGKTYFTTEWKRSICETRGAVYFNAWEVDYSGEPFFDLVAAIKEQLVNQAPTSKKVNDAAAEFLRKSAKVALKAGPEVGKLIVKGLVKKALSTDLDEISDKITEAGYTATESAVTQLLEDSSKTSMMVEEFKNELTNLIAVVSKEKNTDRKSDVAIPVYVFIDELDRCRPTYAVELLERVKHLFDVDNCKFVVATDTSQLVHSIRAVYGVGFDSQRYLRRFFDVTYRLKNDDLDGWAKISLESLDASDFFDLRPVLKDKTRERGYSYMSMGGMPLVEPHKDSILSENGAVGTFHATFIAICKTFRLSLRDVQKVMIHVKSSLANTAGDKVHFFFLLYLAVLRYQDAELFLEMKKGWSSELEDILNKRYPPCYLYFSFENLSVHDIAKVYVETSTIPKKELRERWDALPDNKVEFVADVYMNALNGKRLYSYFDVADLASDLR
ncbi:P-loop NTPase fold protein [Halomonas sp. BN3-1]|uniref:KAP family P-loop NTPase fold protein n=1 Tax=Halomonas sp. BN3-1 TaxID=2082393 RepID=UPI000D35A7C8|nr:P-loop NTPase fold protein [Halomonas sp. BN3-1]